MWLLERIEGNSKWWKDRRKSEQHLFNWWETHYYCYMQRQLNLENNYFRTVFSAQQIIFCRTSKEFLHYLSILLTRIFQHRNDQCIEKNNRRTRVCFPISYCRSLLRKKQNKNPEDVNDLLMFLWTFDTVVKKQRKHLTKLWNTRINISVWLQEK